MRATDSMADKKRIITMVFGFALVCAANLLCFFPQTLFREVASEVYQLFNLTAGLSIVAGSLLCTLLSSSRVQHPERGMLFLGYLSLTVGIVFSFLMGDGTNNSLVVLTGVACGLGIGFLMVCWFSFLALIPERYAMLTQGGQALLGSLIFVFISKLFPAYSFAAAIVCLVISAVLSLLICRQVDALGTDVISRGSLRTSLQIFSNKGSLGQSFSVSLFAFAVISLLYGIITAVIMAPDSYSGALSQATWGGIVGAAIFLCWAFFSKKRDYPFVIKGFFGVLAFVLILPIAGHTLVTAAGYQLICLLFFSLVIDSFSNNRRVLLFILSLSYALTRGLFLLGLYVPGRFGVASYEEFFNSASLLVFLAYLVFIVLLFVLGRERRKSRDEESALSLKVSTDAPERTLAVQEEADPPKDDHFSGDAESFVGRDILLASESLGRSGGLTKRETEVLSYLARGRDVAFICDELYLSRNTVKSYTKVIYAKLNVHSRQELIDVVDQEIKGQIK